MGAFLLAGYLATAHGQAVSVSKCLADFAPADESDVWFSDPVAAARAGERVLGVGFAVEDVPELLVDMRSWHWPAARGLLRVETLPDWHFLGFEPVGFDGGIWHTWGCVGGLVGDVAAATGVRPGGWGLIADEGDARRAAGWLTESGLGDPKVERWFAVKVVDLVPGVNV
ncbi:hypothetical protein V5P93_006027 [Actinokineospora auranticolor]|uniref:Uncharacterized protein n=1 Tax=Actinokineospora auranticolor TaxID=155976 RepID=A0A2S6GC97_9PSEU|nr:hypothetical protein [Actinokineospora auranticolor]PPK62218.1 hypothetical protein CLV40_13629 [Actinokineospora auranticolor]